MSNKLRNKLYLFILVTLSFNIKSGNSTSTDPSEQTIQESRNPNTPITINNSNNLNIVTDIKSSIDLNLTYLKNKLEKISEFTSKKSLKSNSKHLLDSVKVNKWFLFKILIGSSYITAQTTLIYLYKKLNQDNCWSNWKKHLDLEDLYQIPQNEFAQSLLNDIQKKYITINNPTDFISPLINFMQSIEQEQKQITLYKTLVKSLHKIYIGRWFFFYGDKLYRNIEIREKRLNFIKNNFLSWLANFKISTSSQSLIPNKTIEIIIKKYNPIKTKQTMKIIPLLA